MNVACLFGERHLENFFKRQRHSAIRIARSGGAGFDFDGGPGERRAVKRYQFWIDLVATCGFVGRIRPAPGTWGTLWGIPLGLLLIRLGPLGYMLATGVLIMVAIVAAQLHEAVHAGDVDGSGAPRDVHDSQEVVIDEVVGYLVAFTCLPMNWTSVVAAFVLFRALDIVKPFPISWLDRKVKGGLGTVVDDLAAGLVANVILQAVL
ncbi:MAG: phosphatidylglycerophosphatase A [Bdellovibrionales bacterium]|nr:phosphatidylglycerophosphatase A [Bdellovibrionales bacterium]